MAGRRARGRSARRNPDANAGRAGRRWTASAPVVAAVAGFGIPYGVLATAAGLEPWHVASLSAFVFAGSSQFAHASLIAAGSSPLAAALSAAILNARYIATGAVAARVLPGPRIARLAAAQLVVDESYALGVAAGTPDRPDRPDRATLLASGTALWVGWLAGSTVGALIGPVLGDPERIGLDAAFPALFVALLWPLLHGPKAWRSAIAGLAAAAALQPFTSQGVALAGAAVAGIAAYR